MTRIVDYTGNFADASEEKNEDICKYYRGNCDHAYNKEMRNKYCYKNSINCPIHSDLEKIESLEEFLN